MISRHFCKCLTNPAIDGAERGEGGGFLSGASGVDGDNAGEDDETATFYGFNGDDDIAAAEEVAETGAFEAEIDLFDGQGGGGEGGAASSAGAAGFGIELACFAPKGALATAQNDDAGDTRPALVQFDAVEEQESTTAMGGRSGWVELSRGNVTIGVRFQKFAPIGSDGLSGGPIGRLQAGENGSLFG